MTAPPRFSWAEYYRALLGVSDREPDADRLRAAVADWLERWRAARGEIVAAHPAVDGTFEYPAVAFEQLRLLDAEFDEQLDNLVHPPVAYEALSIPGELPTATDLFGHTYSVNWIVSHMGIPAAMLLGQADYQGPQTDYNGHGPSPDHVAGTEVLAAPLDGGEIRITPAVGFSTTIAADFGYPPTEHVSLELDQAPADGGEPGWICTGMSTGPESSAPAQSPISASGLFSLSVLHEARIIFPGRDGEIGLLARDLRIQRMDPQTPGSRGTTVTIGEVIAPEAVVRAFYDRYGNVARPGGDLDVRADGAHFRLHRVYITSVALSTVNGHTIITEGLRLVVLGELSVAC